MNKLFIFIGLSAGILVLFFWNKYLRLENETLENTVNVQNEYLTQLTQKREDLEKILQKRESDINALNQSQKDFKDELAKAKNNNDFKLWFDSSLPVDATRLLKKNTGN